MNVVDFSVLRKDAEHVAFGEMNGEIANVDPGRVLVLGVPGGGREGEALRELEVVYSLDFVDYVHGDMSRAGRTGLT